MLKKTGDTIFVVVGLSWLVETLAFIGVLLWTHFQPPFWFVAQFDITVFAGIIFGAIWTRIYPEQETA